MSRLLGKESACNAGDPGSIPGSGRFLGEGMATHSSVFAWRIPWTEEPGRLHTAHGVTRLRQEFKIIEAEQYIYERNKGKQQNGKD